MLSACEQSSTTPAVSGSDNTVTETTVEVSNQVSTQASTQAPVLALEKERNEVDSRSDIAREISGLSGATDTKQPYDLAKLSKVASEIGASEAPEKLKYQKMIRDVLASEIPIIPLEDLTDPKAVVAQKILIADERLKGMFFHGGSKAALRNEVMSIKPSLPGDRVGAANVCEIGHCYRVDIYNFFHNATISGIVDVEKNKVVALNNWPETQPDLSPRLEALSVAIAKHEPAVLLEIEKFLKFLGSDRKPDQLSPVMAATKSALKNSLCERSKHLCVAPTYVLGKKALWVIVDLTDLRVVGLRWTTLGDSNGPPTIITERKLENEYVFKNFCEQQTAFEKNGWSLNYHITSSDGLRVADVKFQDKLVLNSAKVVDWHVSYSRKHTFGYSDATGCPMFSSAVVVAYDGPSIKPILSDGEEVGFSIAQDFRQLPWPAPCNYRYEERYEFYNDGRYRVALSNHGRGCGDDGTYRPVLRLDLGSASIDTWANQTWKTIESESWSSQGDSETMAEQQYSHRINQVAGQSYLMAPSQGKFNDGGRGDNAFIYTTVKHADKDEGDADLVTLGSCCNTDYQQGPEQFLEPAESLADQDLVLWYVPQIENDGREGSRYCWAETVVVDGVGETKTWPCTSGPMFVPVVN